MLDRARLREAEQEAQSRLSFLADAREVLARSLDYETNLRRVAELAVARVVDWVVVHLVDDQERVQPVVVAHADPEREGLLAELLAEVPISPSDPSGPGAVLRTGRSELTPRSWPAGFAGYQAPTSRRIAETTPATARPITGQAVVVPLASGTRRFGTLSIGAGSKQPGRGDLALAEDLARRAAAAIDNARLYEERLEVVRQLQASLLPPALASLPGAAVGVRYRPAGAGVEVGGDFYDLFEAGSGAWAMVIGDVCGKGPGAAAVTGLARHTIRALAIHDRQPSRVLAGLNHALLSEGGDRFCTVCYARLHREGVGLRATVASAGHPRPLLVDAGSGEVVPVGEPGPPAGMFPGLSTPEVLVELGPGDLLVLYTDGVTERREGGKTFGEEGLQALLGDSLGQPLEVVLGRLEAAVLDFVPEPLRDDVAILALQVAP